MASSLSKAVSRPVIVMSFLLSLLLLVMFYTYPRANQSIVHIVRFVPDASYRQSAAELSQAIHDAMNPNQPINQPVKPDQSINQPTNQPTSQPINQSADQSSDQSTDQSTDQSVDQSADQSADQSVDQSISQPINQFQIVEPVVTSHSTTISPIVLEKIRATRMEEPLID